MNYETEYWEFEKMLNMTKVIVKTKRRYLETKNDCKYGYLEFYWDDFSKDNYANAIKMIIDRKYITEEERNDLLCNVNIIQEMLTFDTRKAKVSFNKSGGTARGTAITNRITIPTSWIKEVGITEDDREVKLRLMDKQIVMEKINKGDKK